MYLDTAIQKLTALTPTGQYTDGWELIYLATAYALTDEPEKALVAAREASEKAREDAEAARRLGSLTQRSDAAGIAQLAGHVGALVVTGYLVSLSIGTYCCRKVSQ